MENFGSSLKRILFIGGGAIVLLLLLFMSPWAVNDSGYRTHVQRFSGEEFIRFEPGVYWAGFFAKTTSYPDVVTVQFEEDKDRKDDISYFSHLMKGQFSDGTYADIGFTVKWKLPHDQTSMLKIHKDYRSAERLAASLGDFSKECMNYSTQMMDSEHHYSGGKSEMSEHFKYQLRHGQYILNQKEELTRDPQTNEVVKRTYVNYPERDSTGHFRLSKSDIQDYKIVPNFVAITHVDYEEVVDEKLQAKVEQSTKESIAKQTLVTAQQEALTAQAEGERKIAETRATEEAAKLQAVIQKEKEVELARLASQEATWEAKRIEAEGRAKALANQALVKAGLTPQERAEYQMKTAIGVAEKLSEIQFPNMMIFGGGQQGPMNPFDALGLESFMKISEKMNADKN